MDALKLFISAVFSDQVTNWVIILLIGATALDWITGSLRALFDKAFTPEAFDVFLRTEFPKAIMLMIILILGRIVAVGAPTDLRIPGIDLSIFTGAGILFAVPFVVAQLSSIVDNARASVAHEVPTT